MSFPQVDSLKGLEDHVETKVTVAVVGGGPGGASVACHLANAGVDVLVLEKAEYPREKVCGDGLTPAAVREILAMGINPRLEDGWMFNRGLTVIGGGHEIFLPWTNSVDLPEYGMARQRTELDLRLILQAVSAGARLRTGANVLGVLTDDDGRVTGVEVQARRDGRIAGRYQVHAEYVVDCGGVAARVATGYGIEKRPDRPIAVAARAYFRSPRGDEDWMESHLELWSGKRNASELLPGYGWVFPLGNGLVNVGLGSVSSTAQATKINYRQVFKTWVDNLPEEWGISSETQVGQMRSAALPMAINRKPIYRRGLVLVGDAAGLVSPFNGEGISSALTSGRIAAEQIIQALGRRDSRAAHAAMNLYTQRVLDEYGSYYNLGRIFVKLIENPRIMHFCTKYGLDKPHLMIWVHKLLSDGFAREGGDVYDRIIQLMCRLAPRG